jgi:hypothetical protein
MNVRALPNGVDTAGTFKDNTGVVDNTNCAVFTVAMFERLNRLNASTTKLSLYLSLNVNDFVALASMA